MEWTRRFSRHPRLIHVKMWLQKQTWRLQQSGRFLVFIVFFTLFLDNMLLTVVVPIVPVFLHKMETDQKNCNKKSCGSAPSVDENENYVAYQTPKHNFSDFNEPSENYDDILPEDIVSENGKVGLLFATKALVQLVANPFIGPLTNRIGCTMPLFAGSIILLISSLMFSFGQTFIVLFAARGVQGLGSSCVSIAGMAMVADRYQDDKERSRIMGVVLGGIALGVLVGYPFGGVMYYFVGKTAPLLVVSGLIAFDSVTQLIVLGPRLEPERLLIGTSIFKLMVDPYILLTAGAICVSTSAIATLEPCLPIWLMDAVAPPRWQLGTVFIPDSVGYLLGTNLFGPVSFRIGRWLTALFSIFLVGICAIMVPFSTHILHLMIPHFGLGLGIGITDAALMPLLAYLVDTRYVALYGSVYAIAQLAVSLAYCLGPLLGGQLVKIVGFSWVIRGIGILNIVYCPLCYLLRDPPSKDESTNIGMMESKTADKETLCPATDGRVHYSTFVDEE